MVRRKGKKIVGKQVGRVVRAVDWRLAARLQGNRGPERLIKS
jgi:hypothetical protein